jgi:FkbM family methyltransferase
MGLRQFIYDSFLHAYARRKEYPLQSKFWSIAKKYLLGSSLVKFRLGKHNIQIAPDHILPIVLMEHPQYAMNLVRLSKEMKKKYPELTMIDIGANIGDTAVLIRSEVELPVLCIDGSEEYYPLLKENTKGLGQVEIALALLGERDEELGAQVLNHDGTAMLVESEKKVRLRRLSSVLNDHPLFQNARLIKIDTDGFDTLIIKGSTDVLQKNHPVVFFEYDPAFLKLQGEDDLSVFDCLRDFGYTRLLFWDNLGNYINSLSISDVKGIRLMHERYQGKKSAEFADIGAFHQEDEPLAETISQEEKRLFYS